MAGPHSRLRRLSCDACWRRSGEFLQQLLGFTRFTQLEVTGISWGLQFEIDGVSQSLWGHHRSRDSGEAMAQKYGKDDVLPALCGQLKVVQAIRRGWCLLTPQARCARRPFTEGRLLPKPSPLVSAPLGLDKADDQGEDTDSESGSESSRASSCDCGSIGEDVAITPVFAQRAI